jgi:hypothetical protein
MLLTNGLKPFRIWLCIGYKIFTLKVKKFGLYGVNDTAEIEK